MFVNQHTVLLSIVPVKMLGCITISLRLDSMYLSTEYDLVSPPYRPRASLHNENKKEGEDGGYGYSYDHDYSSSSKDIEKPAYRGYGLRKRR